MYSFLSSFLYWGGYSLHQAWWVITSRLVVLHRCPSPIWTWTQGLFLMIVISFIKRWTNKVCRCPMCSAERRRSSSSWVYKGKNQYGRVGLELDWFLSLASHLKPSTLFKELVWPQCFWVAFLGQQHQTQNKLPLHQIGQSYNEPIRSTGCRQSTTTLH